LSAIPQTTLGYERAVNWAFAVNQEAEFVDKVLEGQPDPPRYYATMKRVNRDGPRVLRVPPQAPLITGGDFEPLLDTGATIIDTRPADAFASRHVQGTINIPFGKSFLIWAGSVLPYDAPLFLVTAEDHSGMVDSIAKKLSIIGLDDIRGYATWESLSGRGSRTHPTTSMTQTTAAQLRQRIRTDELQIVDVRNGYEWAAGHIEGAQNIPLAHLADRATELDPERPVLVHCQMGGRSAVAASVLEARGFRSVTNLTGGYKAWEESS
jgi:hydroxyacylglutathione hydrolase